MESEIWLFAFDSAVDPMWVIDIEDNDRFRFIQINAAFSQVTGWEKSQVAGQLMESIIPPSSQALVREKYLEAINTGEILDYIEESAHPAGIKYGHIRVIPLKDMRGRVDKLMGIAHDITDKTLLENALSKERDQKNKQITAAAIKGQELERSRVSRELHDNVNQVLTSVKLYTELCLDGTVDYQEVLPKCSQLLVAAINEIRILSKQLSAPTMGNLNYEESISDLVISMRLALGITIELNKDLSDCVEMDAELHLTIYRIMQEQLTNIHKYANADKVIIDLKIDASQLVLRIIDDGVGFDTEEKHTGIGITNMESRTQLLHGSFEINSQIGHGTTLEVRFPIRITDGMCLPSYL